MRSIKAQILITGPLTQAYGKRFTQRIAALWLKDNGAHHVLNCKKAQCRKTRAFLYRGLLVDALVKEVAVPLTPSNSPLSGVGTVLTTSLPSASGITYYFNQASSSWNIMGSSK